MDTFSIILLAILLVILVILIIIITIFNKKLKNKGDDESMLVFAETLKMLKDDIKTDIRETRRELDQKIYAGQKESNENVKYQFDKSQELIKDIHEHLSKVNESVIEVKEGSKQVISMTEQLSNLEKVLTNQKQRGNWGESSLELILSNFLPHGVYQMQYGYKSGEIVDAVIFIKDKILAIDSKFSIDNYRRSIDATNEDDKKYFADEFKKDIKKRIEETQKYINEVDENTLPFAFMFIPSEAIYYDIQAGLSGGLKINTQKLLDFAQEKKVIIVSPTSILAYLHLVITGIKDSKIEENAKEIKKKVEELGKHISKYEEYMQKLGNSLNTTVNHYNASYKELKKIDKDVYKITDGAHEMNIDPVLLDKVNIEEE
ncbi:MAG: DNA recombination protein RmuC [Candidatus Paceibacterota bacterium]|jgi:DNA recombination protein RmuC